MENSRFKFKAWDNRQKEIYTWENLKCNSISVAYLFNNTDLKLMQYTGLKDKNGVSIYEGDIVKLGEYHRTNYENNIAQINWTGYQYAMESHNFSLLLMKTQYIEVIGNIYENPELLKS